MTSDALIQVSSNRFMNGHDLMNKQRWLELHILPYKICWGTKNLNQRSHRHKSEQVKCTRGGQGHKTVVISPSLLWHNVETRTISTPLFFSFFFFFFPCCFLSYGSCFLVAVLFYPLADWCRLYVFPPEPRQPTHNHLLISTPALFIPSSLSSYILRNRSNVSVSCLHLCLLLTRKQPSTSFKHTEGHQAAHTSSWIGAFLWDDYTFVFFSSSSFV